MARPKKIIDENQLRTLMRLKPTLKDTAAFFECSEDTIERKCKELADVSFAEFRDQNMVHTRFSLVRKAITKAESGDNVMLIFCLKNLCDWRDKQPGEEDKVVVNNITQKSEEDIDARIRELMNKTGADKE